MNKHTQKILDALKQGKKLSSKDNDALLKVIDQTELDLEKKNRELEIEAALDRIRNKSMLMTSTKDIGDTVATLFDELVKIGHSKTGRTGIGIYDDSNIAKLWSAITDSKGKAIIRSGKLSMTLDPTATKVSNFWKKGDKELKFELKGQELINYYQAINEADDYELKIDLKKLPQKEYWNIIYYKYGVFYAIGSDPVTDETIIIFKRFAKVFEQTYTRFLDLQKAEAQAREAQIEAALEKVRSRSLAMHNSEELKEAATELYNQIVNLGFEKVDSAGFIFPLPEENIQKCWFLETDTFLFSVFEIPYQGDLVLQERIEASNKGMPYLEQILTGKKLQNHMGIVMPESLRTLELEGAIEAMPSLTIFNMAFFKNGYINLISHDKLSKAEQSILIRFANVFEQTYTRFLDLQKAEEQAREAQIEAALERVRSKTMTMHNSEDVGDTVITLFREVLNLGLDQSIRCGIGILEGFEGMQTWSATLNAKGEVDLKLGMLNMTIHPLLKGVKSWWKKGESGFAYQLIGKDVIKYYKALNNEPDYSFQVDLNTLAEKIYHNSFIFTEGILFAFTSNPLSEEAKSVLKRFTAVFEQTYTLSRAASI